MAPLPHPSRLALAAALALATLTLATSGCKDPSRTDDKALVDHDEDRFPGNDDERDEPGLAETGPEVGTIQSYGRGDDDGEIGSDNYDNVFRRDAEDADFDTYTTEDDMDFPHVDRAGGEGDLDGDGRAGLGTGEPAPDRGAIPADDPSASTIERYDPVDPEDESVRGEIGDPQDNAPYGNNAAVDGPTINEEQAAAHDDADGEPDFDEGIAGGQQTAIGAVGTANDELREYYDTDEEDYLARAGSEGESWGSWYRPLDPYERGYDERTVQIGNPDTEGMGLDARYEALRRRLYDVPENQQAVVYAPNAYTYHFLTGWDGIAVSGEGASDVDYGNETAYDRAPLMGTGCEQADDPVTCSSGELDRSLQRFLNDPRVLRGMMRAGIDGVRFDVDTAGRVEPRSVRALVNGRACDATDDCARFNRAMATALQREEWSPAMRFGRASGARVDLALKYRQTEEQVDFDAEEAAPAVADSE